MRTLRKLVQSLTHIPAKNASEQLSSKANHVPPFFLLGWGSSLSAPSSNPLETPYHGRDGRPVGGMDIGIAHSFALDVFAELERWTRSRAHPKTRARSASLRRWVANSQVGRLCASKRPNSRDRPTGVSGALVDHAFSQAPEEERPTLTGWLVERVT